MHGIKTIERLNEATAASQQKAAWPSPVPAGESTAGSVDTQPDSVSPVPGADLAPVVVGTIPEEHYQHATAVGVRKTPSGGTACGSDSQ